MRTVYLDEAYRCHRSPGENRAPVETDAFDGKCDAFLEGFRFLPEGSVWTREDGEVFQGEMLTPWQQEAALLTAQEQYERLLKELSDAYRQGVEEA